MQCEVHQREPAGKLDDILSKVGPAPDTFRDFDLQRATVSLCQQPLISPYKKAAGPTGGVADREFLVSAGIGLMHRTID